MSVHRPLAPGNMTVEESAVVDWFRWHCT